MNCARSVVRPRRPGRGHAIASLRVGAALLASGLRSAPGSAAAGEPPAAFDAVVACEYIDERDLSLGRSSAVVLPEGLVVPLSHLAGAREVDVVASDGRTWSCDRVLAIHPQAGLALLAMDDGPVAAATVTRDGRFQIGEELTLVRGPGGDATRLAPSVVRGRIRVGEVDLLVVSPGHETGAGAFRPDGTLLGVAFDLSDEKYALCHLVSAASIETLVAHGKEPLPLASVELPAPPHHHRRADPLGLAFRGAILAATDRFADARLFLDLAVRMDPGLPLAHYWIGRVLLAEGRFQDSARSFRTAGELGGDAMAWHMAGVAQNEAGQADSALAMFQEALEVGPESALTWCNVGAAEYRRRNWESAESAFRRSIELDPSFGLAYFNLGLLQADRGESAAADSICRRLQDTDPAWAERLRSALEAR